MSDIVENLCQILLTNKQFYLPHAIGQCYTDPVIWTNTSLS